MDDLSKSQFVKNLAMEYGFLSCGISKADFLETEAKNLEEWLSRGYHGKMSWMENHFELRVDPRKLVPGSKSVISLTYNYSPIKPLESDKYKIAKYSYGEDYHFVLKKKLKSLLQDLQTEFGQFNARVFVDSAPVLERAWANRSGLGWIGKHSLLLNKKQGSFFFIAEIILDLELENDAAVTDHCGTCTACIDACPTDAIIANQLIDSNKCISYLTIELKDEIPNAFKDSLEGWVFGCDICQDVCPWNRFSTPHTENSFKASKNLRDLNDADWIELTEEVFKDVFKKSAVNRAGYLKLQKSIQNVTY